MNKKEQAMVAELKKQIALSWPRYEEPKPKDVPGYELTQGWFQYNYGTDYRVSLGCSTRSGHNPSNPDRTSTQGPGTMYHSKLDALKVARCQMSKRFAEALAKVDAEIEVELARELVGE